MLASAVRVTAPVGFSPATSPASSSATSPSLTRTHDAGKRRERAEEERRATRRTVVAAAQALFVTKGYKATTMADIAREAGVAMQSVYKAGKSKADLLQRVIEVVVAGDDEEML